MSRRDDERLADILASADAIVSHLGRGSLDDGLVFDAVRVRLIEIGEAVKDISAEILATEPHIPWRDVAGMRDQLAHRYFDTAHGIVQATVDEDLPPLVAAVQRRRAAEGWDDLDLGCGESRKVRRSGRGASRHEARRRRTIS